MSLAVIEPPWKVVLSNKAILSILWELFPNHPNLLSAYFSPCALGADYVAKPVFSREGTDIELHRGGITLNGTPGRYGAEGFVYQALAALPQLDNRYLVIGAWIVGDEPAGMGIREDVMPITTNLSHFIPITMSEVFMLSESISTLPSFFAFFVLAVALLAVFLLLYLQITPYREIALIRGGNTAAAVSLSGTLLGFALPMANVIANSHSLVDVATWGVVAGVVQVLAYVVTHALLPHLAHDIPAESWCRRYFSLRYRLASGLSMRRA